ncbi:MAG: (2Fe-2S)-binding protein [Chloroflexi bacterium]|nr:(2Fe-2S)-binding protein [Chloroflexota bacterium]
MIHLMIDDKPIEVHEGRTILEACREHDIHIPTLCYHPALEPYGACRLCVVEVSQGGRKPRIVASCVYPCEEGVVVKTDSPMVQQNRRITAELLLAGSSNSPEIVQLAKELGVKEVRYQLPEEDTCVLCGLCVRACNEIVGVSAISVIQRGIAKKVATPFQVTSSRCIGCGTCVLICPTGAFNFENVAGFQYISPSESAYKLGYYRLSGELDLRPNYVQDVTALLQTSADKEGKHE